MDQIKCTECNQILDETMKECPNCGHPVNKNGQVTDRNKKSDSITTDTGYNHEKQIQYYANFIFGFSKSIGIIFLILFSILGITLGGGIGFIAGLVVGGIVFALIWAFALIFKAYIMVYTNISLNLHEINMKIK